MQDWLNGRLHCREDTSDSLCSWDTAEAYVANTMRYTSPKICRWYAPLLRLINYLIHSQTSTTRSPLSRAQSRPSRLSTTSEIEHKRLKNTSMRCFRKASSVLQKPSSVCLHSLSKRLIEASNSVSITTSWIELIYTIPPNNLRRCHRFLRIRPINHAYARHLRFFFVRCSYRSQFCYRFESGSGRIRHVNVATRENWKNPHAQSLM